MDLKPSYGLYLAEFLSLHNVQESDQESHRTRRQRIYTSNVAYTDVLQ